MDQQTISEKLKPCPFCGGENIRVEIQEPHRPKSSYWWVECDTCRVSTDCDDKEKVVAFWNTRAETKLQNEVDRLKRIIGEYEEESAVCPEDVGFAEYIGVLKKENQLLRDTLKGLVETLYPAVNYTGINVVWSDDDRQWTRRYVETAKRLLESKQ